MKTRLLMVPVIIILAAIAMITGCKDDVTEPLWDLPYTPPASPTITSIDPPSEVKPGVNTITIQGTNFIVSPDTTVVYFDAVKADIVSISNTSITVLRPNLVSDAATIKVVPLRAYTVAKYQPYKIYAVSEKYGSFLDNLALSVSVVDQAENLYVVETGSKNIYKISPNGDKIVFGTASRAPFDARFGPDGNLYLPENNRDIDKVDITTGVATRWTKMPSGKVVKFGDFDANGYYYTAGTRTDLCIVPPNPPDPVTNSDITLAGLYRSDDILAVRVYGNYVYLASVLFNSNETVKIYRHLIGTNGTLGEQELVIDMGDLGEFSSRKLTAFEKASDGTIFISTDDPDPLLRVNPATKHADIFYKGILRPYCKSFAWGKGNYIYMINGNADTGEEWNVYRVDVGSKSGQ